MTPPWREIYVGDGDRQHGFGEAVNEYERLLFPTPYFGPLERYGMGQAADYLLHSVVKEPTG